MTIGIDIDDTITNTADCLLPYVAEYFSLDLDYLIKNNYNYNNLPDEYKDRHFEFGLNTYERVIPLVEGKDKASEIINKLKEDGNKIIIVTARTNRFYSDAYKISKEQLDRLGIIYDKIICSFDKRSACLEEKIDLFIDDSISNLDSVFDVCEDVLLFNSKVNSINDVNYKRVDNWDEVYNYYLENK